MLSASLIRSLRTRWSPRAEHLKSDPLLWLGILLLILGATGVSKFALGKNTRPAYEFPASSRGDTGN